MEEIMAEPVEDRKSQLLKTAIQLATEHGWRKVTRTQIANATGTVESLINYYFGSKQQLRDAIMEEAVAQSLVSVVAEGLVYNHPVARNAPKALRAKATAYIDEHDLKLPRWMELTDNGAVHAWA
jgi:AcrR family transcriptional regulator